MACKLNPYPFESNQNLQKVLFVKDVLEVFSTLGIIVNCGLLITFNVVQKLLPTVTFYESIAIVIIIEVNSF